MQESLLSKLDRDEFDVAKYISQLVPNKNEEEVRSFRQMLKEIKVTTSAELKESVFKNYSEFVCISKEISLLESDMLTLRGFLDELREVNDGLKIERIELEAEVETDNNKTKTSSTTNASTNPTIFMDAYGKHYNNIEDLVRARSLQVFALYSELEGLSKFLPDGRGRYIVRDGSKNKLLELNPTTFKQKPQAVSFYLLNDTLILTSKKKNLISGKTKTVVDKCFGLSEIAVIDVKDNETTNAFKIMKHPDSFLYRCDSLEEKRTFLLLVKRVSDDWLNSRKKKMEANEVKMEVKKEEIIPEKVDHSSGLPVKSSSIIKPEKKHIFDKKREGNFTAAQLSWLEELPDELDVLIAYRDFEHGVITSERARKLLMDLTDDSPSRVVVLRADIENRITKLAKLICIELGNPLSSKATVQASMDRLLRLGLGEHARDIFLDTRSTSIRQLKFDGDVTSYISDLSDIVFKLIRNTADYYGASFRESSMASGFMIWVRKEILNYAEILRKQAFNSNQDFATISKCLELSLHRCLQMKEAGLDFSSILDKLFYADIVNVIELYALKCKEKILKCFVGETFNPCAPPTKHIDQWEADFDDIVVPNISISIYDFHKILTDFGCDMSLLISIPLHGKVVACLKDFFSTYMTGLNELFEKEWTNKQYFTILVDGKFVIEELIPKISAQLSSIRFDRPIPELEENRLELKTIHLAMSVSFIRLASAKLISKDYNFPSLDYSSSAPILDTANPTEHILRVLRELQLLFIEMDSSLDKHLLLSGIIQRLFEFMAEERCWENRKFGFGGVQQFVLDMHFFLRVADSFISDSTYAVAHEICERALRAYFAQNKNVSTPLKAGEWYNSRVTSLFEEIGRDFLALTTLQGIV